jgi:dTDP-4-dehydrorhamnose 3,5-epimerase
MATVVVVVVLTMILPVNGCRVASIAQSVRHIGSRWVEKVQSSSNTAATGSAIKGNEVMPETLQSYSDGEIDGVVIRRLKFYRDARGWLVELFRQDEVVQEWWPVMTYVSETLPGVTRGPHEHVDQTDGFAFIGPSDFKLVLWDTRDRSATRGRRTAVIVGASNPVAVWIPAGVVHAYRNVGKVPGWVFNGPNRLFAGWGKKEPVDEIRHEDADPRRFPMD